MMRKGMAGKGAGLAVVAIAAAIAGTGGCKKNDAGGDQGGSPAAAAPSAPAKPGPWKSVKVDKLGIEVQAPGDTQVLDSGGGESPNAMLTSNECDVMISTVNGAYVDTFAAAKNEISKDPNPFQKFTRAEKTAKGWHLEYELQSMVDKKPLYGVSIRTAVGATQFECGRNEEEAAKRACVTKICESIKKPGA